MPFASPFEGDTTVAVAAPPGRELGFSSGLRKSLQNSLALAGVDSQQQANCALQPLSVLIANNNLPTPPPILPRPPALIRPATPPRSGTPSQRHSPNNTSVNSPKPPRPPKPVTPPTPPLRPFAHKLRPRSAPATVYLTQACPEDGAAELSNYIHVNPSDDLAWCEMVMCNDLVYNVAPHARVAPRCVAMGPLQRKLLTGASEPGKRVTLTPYLPPADLPVLATIEAEYIAWYPRSRIAAFSAAELHKSLLSTLHNQVLSQGQQTMHMSASGKTYCLLVLRLMYQPTNNGSQQPVYQQVERGRVDMTTTFIFKQSEGNPVVVLQGDDLEHDTSQRQDQDHEADTDNSKSGSATGEQAPAGPSLFRQLSVGKTPQYAPPRLVHIPGFPTGGSRTLRPSSQHRTKESGGLLPNGGVPLPPAKQHGSNTGDTDNLCNTFMRGRKVQRGLLGQSLDKVEQILDRTTSALDRGFASNNTNQSFLSALDDFHKGMPPLDDGGRSGVDSPRSSSLVRFGSTGKSTKSSSSSRKHMTFLIDGAGVAFLTGKHEVVMKEGSTKDKKWTTFGVVSCLELLAKKSLSRGKAYVPYKYLISPEAQEAAGMTKEDVSLLKELESKKFVVAVSGCDGEELRHMVRVAQQKSDTYIVSTSDLRDIVGEGLATARWVADHCIHVCWDPQLDVAMPDPNHPVMQRLMQKQAAP